MVTSGSLFAGELGRSVLAGARASDKPPRGRSGGGEDDRDIVSAESERVIEDSHWLLATGMQVGRLDRDLDAEVVFKVVDVDRRRRRLVVQRHDSGNRLDGTGSAQ